MNRLTAVVAGLLVAGGAVAQVATSSSTVLPSGATASGTSSATDATVQGPGAAPAGRPPLAADPASAGGVPGTPGPVGETSSPGTTSRIEMGGPGRSISPSGARGSVMPGGFGSSLIDQAACPPDMRKRDGVCIPAAPER